MGFMTSPLRGYNPPNTLVQGMLLENGSHSVMKALD